MRGIGKQMEDKLNAMGKLTVGGLANADLNELEKKLETLVINCTTMRMGLIFPHLNSL
ncbi:hypothetical protein [Lysinibacillus sphaericus]|uniref:hypothetical protein n=1 Tax=Lysinibacillus sphaericus TaxID=1421 RepID=UPI00190FC7AC|nr:hypothetical protein [Lysinibacillus sphaericus]QPA52740.1 hypothetical protein INQ53_12525 [Lysinibacillus sphaericus]